MHKVPYFVDTTKKRDRGKSKGRGGETKGDFIDNFNV